MIKGPNPGRLNKRISVYEYVTEVTEINTKKQKLQLVRTVWGQMKPTRGSEFLEYYRDSNMLQYKVYMRYHPDITEKHVLVHNGHQYEINAIINVEENDMLMEIYCTEMKDKLIPYAENGDDDGE